MWPRFIDRIYNIAKGRQGSYCPAQVPGQVKLNLLIQCVCRSWEHQCLLRASCSVGGRLSHTRYILLDLLLVNDNYNSPPSLLAKNYQKWLKRYFQRHNFGVFFFLVTGGGSGGGLTNVKLFFLKASLSQRKKSCKFNAKSVYKLDIIVHRSRILPMPCILYVSDFRISI